MTSQRILWKANTRIGETMEEQADILKNASRLQKMIVLLLRMIPHTGFTPGDIVETESEEVYITLSVWDTVLKMTIEFYMTLAPFLELVANNCTVEDLRDHITKYYRKRRLVHMRQT